MSGDERIENIDIGNAEGIFKMYINGVKRYQFDYIYS